MPALKNRLRDQFFSPSGLIEISSNASLWQKVLVGVLGFWLSSSLLLDFVIMPSLYASGMMTATGFATAGYSIFWLFNRVEVLCAAVVLTSVLALHLLQSNTSLQIRKRDLLAGLLLLIALVYTYGLAPQMSALGMQLNWVESVAEVPTGMNQLHEIYWGLEMLKLMAGGGLIYLGLQSQQAQNGLKT